MIDKVQDKVTTSLQTVTTGGGITAVVGGFTLSEALAVGGFLLALAGFIVNWYYQHKKYQLEKERLN